jgi:hypothetical protein
VARAGAGDPPRGGERHHLGAGLPAQQIAEEATFQEQAMAGCRYLGTIGPLHGDRPRRNGMGGLVVIAGLDPAPPATSRRLHRPRAGACGMRTLPVAVHPELSGLLAEHDSYSRAAAVVLCDPIFAHRREVLDHVNGHEINWAGILDAPWSGGERALLQAAASLWRGHGDVDLARLASLGGGFYRLFLGMLGAFRGGR